MKSAHGSKRYLGDSVYVEFDGHGLILTVEHGDDVPSNLIYIDPTTWHMLNDYVSTLKFLASYGGTEN